VEPVRVPTGRPWRDEAACARLSTTQDFFTERGSATQRSYLARIGRAKAVCSVCPVRRECLTEALTVESAHKSFTADDPVFKITHRPGCREPGCRVCVKGGHLHLNGTGGCILGSGCGGCGPLYIRRRFKVSYTPAYHVWGGTTPTERHHPSVKHHALNDRGWCVAGYRCRGCVSVAERVRRLIAEGVPACDEPVPVA